MKRNGILHGELSQIIADLGHGQTLVIGDAGLPIPTGVRRIDLAIRPGLPAFLDVLAAVLAELPVDSCALATELYERNPDYCRRVESLVDAPVTRISHEHLKAECRSAVAVIRTGEWTPYANVVLRAGVTF
jgi:D-ribose pyranase